MNLDAEDRNAIKLIEERMFESFKEDWVNKVSSDQGARPSQANKLRTYNKSGTGPLATADKKILFLPSNSKNSPQKLRI